MLSHSLIYLGEYEEAIEHLKTVLTNNPADTTARIRLIVAYSLSGQKKFAKTEAEEILRQDPAFKIASIETWPIKNKEDQDLIMNKLREAGLPE
ncbi:MAG: tetratricopeptide repeat protein [Desulfobacter sp.]|nr:MAG: tetratricopeptide repeat protein [Desulfobacter sp.]